MIKKIVRLFITTTVLVSLQVSVSYAENYKEGLDYFSSSQDKSSTPSLKEYFSVYCPSCYAFEGIMPQVKTNMPEGMKFERVHVDFLGVTSQEVQRTITTAYVYAVEKGVGDKFIKHAFDRIHVSKDIPRSKDDAFSLLQQIGFEKDEITSGINSFTIKRKSALMGSDQDSKADSGVLKGVPSLMVNNKYMINFKELNKNDPVADLNQLIKHLNSL
jgi:thiol:disulfide interchange protein DsbA